MPTDCLFREDSYLKDCEAKVVAVAPDGGIVLDRTVFYAASGGQPADKGTLVSQIRRAFAVANVVFTDPARPRSRMSRAPGSPAFAVGDTVTAAIDWPIRHARMRMHTALHLLSAVLPYPGHRRLDRRGGKPARLRHSRSRPRQGRDHRKTRRDDRDQCRGHQPLDHRRRARSQSRAWSRPCRSSRRWAPAGCG